MKIYTIIVSEQDYDYNKIIYIKSFSSINDAGIYRNNLQIKLDELRSLETNLIRFRKTNGIFLYIDYSNTNKKDLVLEADRMQLNIDNYIKNNFDFEISMSSIINIIENDLD